MPSPLGDKIRVLRKQKKLSLEQLAELTESSKSYIWELENKDDPKPSADKIGKIASVLEVTSNQAAFKSGAYFATRKNTIELPQDALAHSNNLLDVGDQLKSTRAQTWFPREPASMPLTEMTRVTGQYDYSLTLLLMPDAEWQGPQHDDGEPEEDTFDRFIRNGQYPVQ